jgi:hypothetical protein
MKYRDFKSAAHRHLICCQKMCDTLSSISNQEEKNAIIANIYYLSGYVFETLLSYAIFSISDKNTRKNPVEEHPEYNNGFKTHDFQAKIDFAIKHKCDLNGIMFISQKHKNDSYMKLYREWKIELRYWPLKSVSTIATINEDLIKGYIDSIKEVENQFNGKFI